MAELVEQARMQGFIKYPELEPRLAPILIVL